MMRRSNLQTSMTSIWCLRVSPCLVRGTELMSRARPPALSRPRADLASGYAPDLAERLDALDRRRCFFAALPIQGSFRSYPPADQLAGRSLTGAAASAASLRTYTSWIRSQAGLAPGALHFTNFPALSRQ
jgi:hypothetical protein